MFRMTLRGDNKMTCITLLLLEPPPPPRPKSPGHRAVLHGNQREVKRLESWDGQKLAYKARLMADAKSGGGAGK